ncbi:MAG: glycosyl hydrolase family 17 protein [Candidatus Nanoarchaeia archaeon]
MGLKKTLLSLIAGVAVFSPFLQKKGFASDSLDIKPVHGICYSPFREGQSPETGVFPTTLQEKEDLEILNDFSRYCRTYGNDNNLYYIPQFCNEKGINCFVGTWISDDATWNQGVINRLVEVSNANYPTTKALLVGNEYLLWRNWNSESTLISLINQLKTKTDLPVSSAETYNIWLQHPNLANACDFIGAHIHPYWEGVHVDNAADHVINKYNLLKQTYPNKEIIILEVGWPSGGATYGSAVPSSLNQEKFLRKFITKAKENDIKYFLFTSFNEPWKAKYGEVEKNWGIYKENRVLKPGLQNIVKNKVGDVNFDGNRDIYDLRKIIYPWLSESNIDGPYLPGDINQDAKIDLEDFAILAENWDRY